MDEYKIDTDGYWDYIMISTTVVPKVVDSNHRWRMLTPVVSQKRACGCYVRPMRLQLCERGQYLYERTNEWFEAYEVGGKYAEEYYEEYRAAIKQYLEHLGI